MSQTTELPPLTPSFGHLVGAWLRPFAVPLYLGFRLLPALVPLAMMWMVFDEINELASDPEIEAAFAESASEWSTQPAGGGMFDLIPVLLVVMMGVVMFTLIQRLRPPR